MEIFLYNMKLVFEEDKILAYMIIWYKPSALSEASYKLFFWISLISLKLCCSQSVTPTV